MVALLEGLKEFQRKGDTAAGPRETSALCQVKGHSGTEIREHEFASTSQPTGAPKKPP